MKKTIVFLLVGVLLLTIGVYVSTFSSTLWIVIGTVLAISGGFITGSCAYFMPKPDKK
ncbi:hypothetical protein [Metabacillus malikii]|uniref:Membrane protein n=1 Tax=Metabacillus malikii TaxID=1504265 RepID=A0ABT9ZDN8_9BACI|nr:hypothetical protein [Metabacillus malikii]MDQ0230130.1 putative membrane protein [Metabacillus malikii]